MNSIEIVVFFVRVRVFPFGPRFPTEDLFANGAYKGLINVSILYEFVYT